MNAEPYTHIVFSGGGMQGLVYIGVYRYLKQYNLLDKVRHLVGCSIGSLVAYLFALDFSVEELEKFILLFIHNPKYIKYDLDNIWSLYDNKGLYDISKYELILIDAFKEKYQREITSITFQEFSKITGKNIYITSMQLSSLSLKVFSNIETPNINLFTAILASMAIPFIFKPVIIENEYYIDGGVKNSFPIECLTYTSTDKVLGLYLSMMNNISAQELLKPLSFFTQVITAVVFSNASDIYTKIYEALPNIDILHFNKNPLSFIPIEYLDEVISITITTEQYEEAVYYGYNLMYQYLKNKSKDSPLQIS